MGAEDISLLGAAVRASEQPPEAEREERMGVLEPPSLSGMKDEACQNPPWLSSAQVLQV